MNAFEYMQRPEMREALLNTSVSVDDAAIRGREYAKMFSRNDDMKEIFGTATTSAMQQRLFSGYAETPLLSTQYFNASVASYVSSFAGFMSIEKDFDQPNGLFYWFDVLGVSDMRTVMPNLGADQLDNVRTLGGFEQEVTTAQAVDALIGRKLIPGSIRVRIVNGADVTELVDNGQGRLNALAGVLASDEITYLSGRVKFNLASAPAAGAKITIYGKEDATGTPCGTNGAANGNANQNRFLGKMQQLPLSTVPDMLVAEYNIAALGAMKKATGSDMASFLFGKLREMYTKAINRRLVTELQAGYAGNTMNDLDLSNSATGLAQKFYDYRSRVDLFDAYLLDVENSLATKAVKGVTTTAYVAGNRAATQFQKAGIIGKWEKNTKMTYINDLLGWYDGVPVLRSTDVAEADGQGTFFAIHKTADGQMAPLARGIYMPLTDTPTIGNYNNPTQMAAGVYYQEGTRYMATELAQKVTFKVGF